MKVFGNDQILDYPDMNFLSSRVINVYNSVDDRASAIPSPHNGQMAYVSGQGLTLFGGMSGGVGGAWRRLVSLPPGGTAGQVLAKKSDADYDYEWITPA